jgi:hypothetical protein
VVVSESIQTLADGNRIVQRSTGRVFRDSQGRVRREEDRPSATPAISIFDPTRGVTIVLDQGNRTARETASVGVALANAASELGKVQALVADADRKAELAKLAAELDRRKAEADGRAGNADAERRKIEVLVSGRAAAFVRNANEEIVDEKLPDRMIEGVWATGVRRTTTIAKGAIGNEQPIKTVSEEWTSPDLQVLVSTDRNDPRSGRSTYRLLKVGLGEPDPTLFQVPADYTVQRPGARGGASAPPSGGTTGSGERGRGGRGIAPR